MEQHPVRRDNVIIKSYEVDCTGTLKLQSLLSYFQEIAGKHAEDLGVGYEELERRDLFWVLSRVKIQITRIPAWREVVILSTWPKGVDRLFALRDFRMIDDRENVLLQGTTAWLLLERKKNRPQKLDLLPTDIFHYEVEHAIREPLERIKPADHPTLLYERKILASDLDVNNHVNNAEYMKWIVDCFPVDHVRTHLLRSIQVNYLEEVLFSDTIALYRDQVKDEDYYLEGISRNTGSKVFQALLSWQLLADVSAAELLSAPG